MIKALKKKYALSDQGAKDLLKGWAKALKRASYFYVRK